MAFTEQQFQAFGYALRSGLFETFTAEQQLKVFERGFGDDPKKLYSLSKKLKDDKRIKFPMVKLVELAKNEMARRKQADAELQQQKQQQRQEQAQAGGSNVIQMSSVTPQQPEIMAAMNAATGSNIAAAFTAQMPEAAVKLNPGAVNPALNQHMPQQVVANSDTEPVVQRTFPQVNYPEGYNTWTQEQKADYLLNLIVNTPGLKKIYNPFEGLTMQQKMVEIEKQVEFIKGAHPGFTELQANCLGNLLGHPRVKSLLNKFGALNNAKFVEVPIGDYDTTGNYDFAFTVKTNNIHKSVLVLWQSIPVWNSDRGVWINQHNISVLDSRKDRNEKQRQEQQNADMRLSVPLREIFEEIEVEDEDA